MAERFRFNFEATLQAVAYLLGKCRCGQHSYGSIFKILYIADREAVRSLGAPISGAEMRAFEHGPSLQEPLDLARLGREFGCDPGPDAVRWKAHIATRPPYYLQLLANPGVSALSPDERAILDSAFDRYGNKTFGELSDITHKFAEWVKNSPGPAAMERISLRDLIEGLECGPFGEEILQNAADEDFFAALPEG